MHLYNENSKAKSRSFNFYLDKDIKYIDSDYLKIKSNPKPDLVFTNEEGLRELKNIDSNFIILQKFDHTRVSKLKTSFINPKPHRNEHCSRISLCLVDLIFNINQSHHKINVFKYRII